MMAAMVTGDPDPEDVRKYFGALRKAQRELGDLTGIQPIKTA